MKTLKIKVDISKIDYMKFNIIVFIFLVISANQIHGQQELNLYGNLEFGSYNVGVKELVFTDNTGSDHRKINIHLWYPSEKAEDKGLKFGDYLNYKNKFNIAELTQEISVKIGGEKNILSDARLKSIINAPVRAFRNSKEVDKKFPLVVWSGRYETVEYQNIISEYIASYGYVVAFAEDVPNSPYPWQLSSNIEKEESLNRHVANLDASIDFLKSQKNVDPTKIGLIAWSYAGESAILTQMDNKDIDLVIGLSAISFSAGVYLGAGLVQKINLTKLKTPYLILSQKLGANGRIMTAPDIFHDMHPDSRYVSFKELAHGNFNAIEGMIPGILGSQKVQSWSKGGEVAKLGYETICEITLFFLEDIFNDGHFDNNISSLVKRLPAEFIATDSPNN